MHKLLRWLKRLLLAYLVTSGVVFHIAALVGLWGVLNYFQLTPAQFVDKAMEKSGIEVVWLQRLLHPAAQFEDVEVGGEIRDTHPRIILPQLVGWSGNAAHFLISQREALYRELGVQRYDPCQGGGIMGQASCWLAHGGTEREAVLLSAIAQFEIQTPNVSGNYGDGWQLAFAYDIASLSPQLSAQARSRTEARIAAAVEDYLLLLDGNDASLWHGRTSLAAMAWLSAIVLDGKREDYRSLQRRAHGHLFAIVEAIELTEAWPEGYNYWINSRAFTTVLALGAYLNGVEDAEHRERVVALLERIGLWHIYVTRPDNRAEGIGDEGSRVDLKDETRRVIDLIAQLTRKPLFSRYSAYLEKLHGPESYYRDYRWSFLLLNDPTVDTQPLTHPSLSAIGSSLPKAQLFGRDAMGLGYLRSGWQSDSTFISFRAGDSLSHHGHYDAGHFSLFKGAPLAINSSVYGDFMSANRLNYSIRTVAKNSLLIQRPGERVRPNRFFGQNVADGGQRVTQPTGSAIASVDDWYEKLDSGPYLAGGQINAFASDDDAGYSYVASDLTAAYNSPEHDDGGSAGKVESVKRHLLYLHQDDRLIVYDQVRAVDSSYRKKWLLHTVTQPQADALRLLKGTSDNGILETSADFLTVTNKAGSLAIQRLLPADGVARIVGGRDYQYYVESDGDDRDLDGENFSQGAIDKPWFDVGYWRMEIQPVQARQSDEFLIALAPSLGEPRSDRIVMLDETHVQGGRAIQAGSMVALFVAPEARSLQLQLPGGVQQLLLLGLPTADKYVSLLQGDQRQQVAVSAEGVALIASNTGNSGQKITVSW